jgi:protein-disulfide isomerase
MDFQCPFCAKWAARVDSVIEQVPTEVRVVFHHFPLSAIHAHALPAAIAAECADQQGIFPAFKKEVFHRQNEIGVTHWRDFAMEAKIPNITRFEQCIAMPTDSFPRIAHGLKLAADHRMTGTPTVWVNGQVSQPSTTALIEMARGASK